MDRNQAIGLVLISAMFLIYFTWFAPTPPAEQPQNTTDTTSQITQQAPEPSTNTTYIQADTTVVSDSVANAINSEKFGIFANSASGKAEMSVLENDNIKVQISSKGASINHVLLKDFKTYTKEPLVLLDENSSTTSLTVNHAGRQVNLSDLYYTPTLKSQNDTIYLVYKATVGTGQYIQQTYSLPKQGYEVGYSLQLVGLSAAIDGSSLLYLWDNRLKMLEHDITETRKKASLNYYLSKGDFEDIGDNSTSYEEEQISTPIDWVAMKQKFFTSAFIADKNFTNATLTTDIGSDPNTVKVMTATLSIPLDHLASSGGQFKYYFGPNNFAIYEKVAPGFSDNLNLGWPPVNLVNKYVIINLFHFFEKYISNYGIIILILVIVIKLFLSPLSYKSYISMAKTKVLKPELDALKEKYGDDMQKIQSEQMKLYQQVGVNPISGCIPMLLQMPILFAMFFFFPNSIELRQQSFLWATDLSTYDSVLDLPFTIPFYGSHVSLFTLLMTASTILYTWSNNQASSVQGPMKTITYMMPIMFLFFLNSFSAGLTYYYFVSNLVTFAQQAIIRKFIDEDKIKAILEENRKNAGNRKVSKFQQRLQDAMKASQEKQKKKKTKKK